LRVAPTVELKPGSKVQMPVSGYKRRTSTNVAPAASRSTGSRTSRPSGGRGAGDTCQRYVCGVRLYDAPGR